MMLPLACVSQHEHRVPGAFDGAAAEQRIDRHGQRASPQCVAATASRRGSRGRCGSSHVLNGAGSTPVIA